MFLTVHFVNIGFRNKNKSGEWPLTQLISRINYLSVKSWLTPVSKMTGRSVSRIQGDCTRRGVAVWGPGPRTWHSSVDILSYKRDLESSYFTFFHIITTRRRIFLYRSAQTTCLGLNGLVDSSDNHFLLYSCPSVFSVQLTSSSLATAAGSGVGCENSCPQQEQVCPRDINSSWGKSLQVYMSRNIV